MVIKGIVCFVMALVMALGWKMLKPGLRGLRHVASAFWETPLAATAAMHMQVTAGLFGLIVGPAIQVTHDLWNPAISLVLLAAEAGLVIVARYLEKQAQQHPRGNMNVNLPGGKRRSAVRGLRV
jgi:hypothetical protein